MLRQVIFVCSIESAAVDEKLFDKKNGKVSFDDGRKKKDVTQASFADEKQKSCLWGKFWLEFNFSSKNENKITILANFSRPD